MAKQKLPRDPNGRHIRVYCTLLESPAYRVLGYSAQALFTRLRASVNGTNNGNISATLSTLKHYGWTSSATLASALHELQTMGFIAQTRGGGVRHGSKVCTLYRFTDLDCFEFPKLGIPAMKADHLYLRFESVTDARKALKEAKQKKTTLQKLKHTASEIEALEPFTASETEVESPSLLQKLKQTEGGQKEPQSQAAQGFQATATPNHDREPSTSESEHLYMLPSLRDETGRSDGDVVMVELTTQEAEEWL